MAKKVKNETPAVEATAGAIATQVEEKPNDKVKTPEAPEPSEPEAEKDEMAEKAAELFRLYPAAKNLLFTSDGTAFFELVDANNHASSLADKKVRTINR